MIPSPLRGCISRHLSASWGTLTVEMIPGTRMTGCFALKPRSAIASPTVNSSPLVFNFHGSGMLLLSLLHSFSTKDQSN